METETFTLVARLMICSWRDKFPGNQEVETFIAYFIKQWLNPKRMDWFEQYVSHVPCQDNGLESTNRYVQDDSFRRRLPINKFLILLETVSFNNTIIKY